MSGVCECGHPLHPGMTCEFLKEWSYAKQPPASPFENLGAEVGRLVAEKQVAYGDSFGKSGDVMRVLYPNGISPEQMDDALTIVRILDKLFRVAHRKEAFGENPYQDIVGYALLAAVRGEKK